MDNSNTRTSVLFWVALLCIALGFLESAVVIYLREIYYPEGFGFPLKAMHDTIIATELFREAATLVILLSIGFLTGRNILERFAFFLFSFAVWDIFYYVFLKLLINWPDSLFTWDVLFLLPVTWVGPVLSPVIVSITMIFLAVVIIRKSNRSRSVCISKYSWGLLIVGSIAVFLSFVWEYSSYMISSVGLKDLLNHSDPAGLSEFAWNFIPQKFNWFLFIAGELLIISGIIPILIPKFHKK